MSEDSQRTAGGQPDVRQEFVSSVQHVPLDDGMVSRVQTVLAPFSCFTPEEMAANSPEAAEAAMNASNSRKHHHQHHRAASSSSHHHHPSDGRRPQSLTGTSTSTRGGGNGPRVNGGRGTRCHPPHANARPNSNSRGVDAYDQAAGEDAQQQNGRDWRSPSHRSHRAFVPHKAPLHAHDYHRKQLQGTYPPPPPTQINKSKHAILVGILNKLNAANYGRQLESALRAVSNSTNTEEDRTVDRMSLIRLVVDKCHTQAFYVDLYVSFAFDALARMQSEIDADAYHLSVLLIIEEFVHRHLEILVSRENAVWPPPGLVPGADSEAETAAKHSLLGKNIAAIKLGARLSPVPAFFYDLYANSLTQAVATAQEKDGVFAGEMCVEFLLQLASATGPKSIHVRRCFESIRHAPVILAHTRSKLRLLDVADGLGLDAERKGSVESEGTTATPGIIGTSGAPGAPGAPGASVAPGAKTTAPKGNAHDHSSHNPHRPAHHPYHQGRTSIQPSAPAYSNVVKGGIVPSSAPSAATSGEPRDCHSRHHNPERFSEGRGRAFHHHDGGRRRRGGGGNNNNSSSRRKERPRSPPVWRKCSS